jgi:hypothetical protein
MRWCETLVVIVWSVFAQKAMVLKGWLSAASMEI